MGLFERIIEILDKLFEKPRARNLISRYTQAINEGKIYVDIYQSSPFSFEENAFLERGRYKFILRNYSGAKKDYLIALETVRNTKEKYYTYCDLGELYCKLALETGNNVNYRHALEYYNSAVSTLSRGTGLIKDSFGLVNVEEVKDEPYAYVLRGLVKCKLKDYTGAIKDFTKAINLDSNNSSIKKYGLIDEPEATVANLLKETKKIELSSDYK